MRREALALLAALALYAGFAAALFDPMPSIGGDDARYMVLAEALESGRGYRDVHRPGEPLHVLYPPLYPLLLALLRGAGGDIVAYKALSVAFGAASLLCAFALARPRLGPSGALAFAAAWGLAPGLLAYSDEVLTETLFTALVLGSLAAAERRASWRGDALAVGAALLAFATRSAGLALLLALPLAFALERRFRAASAAAAATATALAASAAWVAFASDAGELDYLDALLLVDLSRPDLGRLGAGDLLARAAGNALGYARSGLPAALGGGPWPAWVGPAASASLLALALLGALRRRPRALECFAAIYAAQLCLWIVGVNPVRYLLPLLPCLLLLALEGVARLAGSRRRLVPAAAALFALLALPKDLRLAQASDACREARAREGPLACYGAPWRAYFELAIRAGSELPRDAVVVCRKPHGFYYFSGLHAEGYPFTRDAARVQAFLDEVGASHVVVDELDAQTQRFLLPALRAQPARFEPAQRVERGEAAATLWQRRPAAERSIP